MYHSNLGSRVIQKKEKNRLCEYGAANRLCEPGASERRGNNLHGFEDFHFENGSSKGQNLALTVVDRLRVEKKKKNRLSEHGAANKPGRSSVFT